MSFAEGTLGVINNVGVNHNLDNPDAGVFHTATGVIIPKLLEITIDFSVVHETHLGWDETDNFSDHLFPYGVDVSGARTKGDYQLAVGEDQVVAKQEAEGIFQELEDERFLQAQQDIAKAMFLNSDGSLNSYGKRMQRRLDETSRAPGDRRIFTTGIKNPEKARFMRQALASTQEGATAADVRQAGEESYLDAADLGNESWSWIK